MEESSPGDGNRLRNSDSFIEEPIGDGVGFVSFSQDVLPSMSPVPARAEMQRRAHSANSSAESGFGKVSETNISATIASYPAGMPHSTSLPETNISVHSPVSSSTTAAQYERDRTVSYIPRVLLVEDGRQENEGKLLLKGGLVTSQSKDAFSFPLVPGSTLQMEVPTIKTDSSVVEDERKEGDICECETAGAGMEETTDAPPVSLLQPSRNTKTPASPSPLKLMASAKKWKNRTMAQKMIANLTIAKDARHQEILDRQVIRACTEIPRSFLIDVLEEALPIVQKTAQIYKRELGSQDPLTVQAAEHLEKLKERLR